MDKTRFGGIIMQSINETLTILLLAMLIWAGGYAVYTAFRLSRERVLFDNKFLYPANCSPDGCKDANGFIAFILPRLWILGLVCLGLAAVTVLANYTTALGFLPVWFVRYGIPVLGFAVFVWYITVNARSSKQFW
jgi:hypothetical protein